MGGAQGRPPVVSLGAAYKEVTDSSLVGVCGAPSLPGWHRHALSFARAWGGVMLGLEHLPLPPGPGVSS